MWSVFISLWDCGVYAFSLTFAFLMSIEVTTFLEFILMLIYGELSAESSPSLNLHVMGVGIN